MITSWTISQLLRLRHAKAEAKAHAVTDSVASAQDVAAMFLTSLAFKLLCRARAWAEETILSCARRPRAATSSWQLMQSGPGPRLSDPCSLVSAAVRVGGAELKRLPGSYVRSAHPRFLRSLGATAEQQWDNERYPWRLCSGLSTASSAKK